MEIKDLKLTHNGTDAGRSEDGNNSQEDKNEKESTSKPLDDPQV